jgi:type II secretory pathway pseudopilin PulG
VVRRNDARVDQIVLRSRDGMALVTTLAMLALAAALLAGAFAQASASSRAARSARAGLVASALARRALGRAIAQWSAVEDSLVIGGIVQRSLPESAAVLLDSADTRLRVQRLSATLYVIAADVSVPGSLAPLARRRIRVLVEYRAPFDSTLLFQLPRPLARWALGDLY